MKTAILLCALGIAPLAATASPEMSTATRDAVEQAIAVPNARLVIREYRPTLSGSCNVSRAEISPIAHSGRLAVKLFGRGEGGPCSGWAWVRVQLFAQALVVSHPLRQGQPLRDSVVSSERELTDGHPTVAELPDGAVADQSLSIGTVLQPSQIRTSALRPGSAVTVVLQSGMLELRQPARLVPCIAGRACAVLASGKRVEGHLEGNLLRMEMP